MIYTLYIDEAGDEGFGKLTTPQNPTGQSRLFGLGGILVSKEVDKKLPQIRDAINKAISPNNNNRKLHFKKFSHEQKVVACQKLAKEDVLILASFVEKSTIFHLDIQRKPSMLYTSLVSKLIAHTLDFVRSNNAKLEIVFSRREGTHYAFMFNFIRNLKIY